MPLTPERRSPQAASFGVLILAVATLAIGFWAYSVRTPTISSQGTLPGPTGPVDTFSSAKASPTPEPEKASGQAGSETVARRRMAAPTPSVSPKSSAPAPAAPREFSNSPGHAEPSAERISPANGPAEAPHDGPIYDVKTADVTPPSLLTPIAIAPVRKNADYVPGAAAIEIVVNRDGLVNSVKAARAPATIGEALEMANWLSTTKSWRFGPAVRDGQPVRYRLVVPLSALVSGRGLR